MKQIISLLSKYNSFAIFSHENPDPDTIGSTLALKDILEQFGKKVTLFCESKIPETYFLFEDAGQYCDNYETAECLISVDVASSHMLGRFESIFLNFDQTIRIDHHISGDNFAKYNLVKPYSACAILIYELVKKLKAGITPVIATKLYFAICGDTSIFKNSNTDSLTFKVASELLKLGANINKVYDEFFDKKTIPYVKMSSHLLEKAIIEENLGYAVLVAKKEDFENYNLDPQNDNLGNLPKTYLSCGLKIAVILKEKEDGIHCSFRSKLDYDVSNLAQQFGGGGHKNASGCLINSSTDVAINEVVKVIENYLKNY